MCVCVLRSNGIMKSSFNSVAVISFVLLYSRFEFVSTFKIPPVLIEVFAPKGLRVSIPDSPGIEKFVFHANINKPIGLAQGTINIETTSTSNGRWSIYDDYKLLPQDTMYYWILVQHNRLGYRRTEQTYLVEDLEPFSDVKDKCFPSKTIISGGTIPCKDSLIFEEQFEGSVVDLGNWIVERRIPTYTSPDSEFNSYINSNETVYVQDSKLFLKPIAHYQETDLRGELDLRNGCTGVVPLECYYKQKSVFLLPPVTSGRIVSRISFRYGVVEIKGRLPEGDWIFPEVLLEPANNDGLFTKILIAYCRGNPLLRGANYVELGSTVLGGGPILKPKEPERSRFIKTKSSNIPYFEDFHTYRILWDPERITVSVDNREYGSINKQEIKSTYGSINLDDYFDRQFRIALGVGVGGTNNFPDHCVSNQTEKPWRNYDRDILLKFFNSRDVWLNTWKKESSTMQIDYVKIWAI